MSKFNFVEFNKIKTKVAKKGKVETKYGEVIIKEIQGSLLLDIADENKKESDKIKDVLMECIISPDFSKEDVYKLVDNDTGTSIDIFMEIMKLGDNLKDVEIVKKN
jgi:hypothetical protein